MDTNQKHQFRQQTDNEPNQPFAGKQLEGLQKEPDTPTPDKQTIPEQHDENISTNRPEPGINDPTLIDEEQPIFNYY